MKPFLTKLFKSLVDLCVNARKSCKLFCNNLNKSIRLMKPFERLLAVCLLAIAFVLLCVRLYDFYIDHTKLVPTAGGEITDAIVGEVKYINPILAQSDAEKTASSLIFSGLIKIENDQIVPDLAEKWEITNDGKKYTFYLRKDALFHDGENVTANDIAYTINSIKTPEMRSPLLAAWSDVTVGVIGDYTVSFDLPKSYGPFIYNCAFGVLPANVPSDVFAKKFIGSGPYKFIKANKKNNIIKGMELKMVPNHYLGQTYIDKIKLAFYTDQVEAKKVFDAKKADLLSGVAADSGKKLDFKTSKRMQLILNSKDTVLKEKDFRQKLLTGQKFADKVILTLTTPDNQLQKDLAEQLKTGFANQNVELNINYYNPLKMQDVLSARNYQLLLYGFDFGYDRDPYVFWQTTQADKMNFSGWSDKATDIMLEDARMITDNALRNQKYDAFFEQIKAQYLYQDFDPVLYSFSVGDKVKNILPITGTTSEARYDNVASWFIREKRVGKSE